MNTKGEWGGSLCSTVHHNLLHWVKHYIYLGLCTYSMSLIVTGLRENSSEELLPVSRSMRKRDFVKHLGRTFGRRVMRRVSGVSPPMGTVGTDGYQ